MSGDAERDVIFEITRIGEVQRVAAVDVASGVEVVVQTPANTALADAHALALRKLERALGGAERPSPKRPGTIV